MAVEVSPAPESLLGILRPMNATSRPTKRSAFLCWCRDNEEEKEPPSLSFGARTILPNSLMVQPAIDINRHP